VERRETQGLVCMRIIVAPFVVEHNCCGHYRDLTPLIRCEARAKQTGGDCTASLEPRGRTTAKRDSTDKFSVCGPQRICECRLCPTTPEIASGVGTLREVKKSDSGGSSGIFGNTDAEAQDGETKRGHQERD
jgi:hypothetical protein